MTEDFHLWLAKERRAKAETAYDEMNSVMERVKSRGTSLLGLTVTLTTGSLVAASQSRGHRAAAYTLATGFFVSSVLCVRTLYSTDWSFKGWHPDDFDAVIEENGARKDELAATNAITNETAKILQFNSRRIIATRRYLRWSQRLAAITPMVAALIAFLVWARVPQLVRQFWWQMIKRHS